MVIRYRFLSLIFPFPAVVASTLQRQPKILVSLLSKSVLHHVCAQELLEAIVDATHEAVCGDQLSRASVDNEALWVAGVVPKRAVHDASDKCAGNDLRVGGDVVGKGVSPLYAVATKACNGIENGRGADSVIVSPVCLWKLEV